MTDFPAYTKCSILQTRNITYSAHTTMTDPTPDHQKPAFEAEPTGNRLLDIAEWNLGSPHGPTPNRPLWQAMQYAYAKWVKERTANQADDRIGYAAELRAANKWIWRHVPFDYIDPTTGRAYYDAENLRAVIKAEAKKAEAGE
jgi:hypothetical protein